MEKGSISLTFLQWLSIFVFVSFIGFCSGLALRPISDNQIRDPASKQQELELSFTDPRYLDPLSFYDMGLAKAKREQALSAALVRKNN